VVGADNRLLSDGTWNYSYDNEGNLVKKTRVGGGATWNYGYDFHNHLTSASQSATDGGPVQLQDNFQYDALDRRITETVAPTGQAATTQHFVYNGQEVWADLSGTNQVQTRYLHGSHLDEIWGSVSAAGNAAWYWTDRLGSVRDITDGAGTVVDHINYDSFGNVLSETNPAAGSRYKFTGRELDSTTGLYHYRDRQYDPTDGRFTSEDRKGFRGGDLNLYGYVHNQPTGWVDPTGFDRAKPNADYGEFTSIIQHWDPDVWRYLQIHSVQFWWQERAWWLSDGYGDKKDGRNVIVIRSSLNSMEAAEAIIRIVREKDWCADFHGEMRTDKNFKNEGGFKEYFKAEKEWREFVIKRIAQAGIVGATAYLSILSVMNVGVDFTVTLAEVLEGNYLVAILRVLPVAANGTVKFIFRRTTSSGKFVEEMVVLNKKQIEALVKGTKMTYEEAQKLTKGCDRWLHGHHIIEQWVLKFLKKEDTQVIVQILMRTEHEKITGLLNAEFSKKLKWTKEEIWAVYQRVYTDLGHKDWLDLIAPFFL
jgi:RHS repeat-associated protein